MACEVAIFATTKDIPGGDEVLDMSAGLRRVLPGSVVLSKKSRGGVMHASFGVSFGNVSISEIGKKTLFPRGDPLLQLVLESV